MNSFQPSSNCTGADILQRIFPGDSEMARRMRAFDWSKTALGPPEFWPQSLKISIRIMLTSRHPMFVWWGEPLINLYNDSYAAFLCTKHPAALGQPAASVWPEVWEQIGPRAEFARCRDEGTCDEALPFILLRNGYPEEAYVTFSYSPIPGDDDVFGGILCTVTEETERILGERQLALLRVLAAKTANIRSWRDASLLAASALETNPDDLPFALIYVIDAEQETASLAATSGLSPGSKAAAETVAFDAACLWPLAEVSRTCSPRLISDLSIIADELPSVRGQYSPSQAIALPLALSGEAAPAGVLVAGLNPLRLFKDSYQRFLELVAAEISAAISHAQADAAECRNAETQAEDTRGQDMPHALSSTMSRISAFVDGALQRSDSPASHSLSGVEEPSKIAGARILVVDDNADLRSYLTRLLASSWAVEAAADGKAALDILRREPFDLVLTDVMMPQLNGFGLLKELRADPDLQALPVIMLSARAEEESSIERLHAGADDYLIKPFSAPEVIARVETHLRLSATRRHLAAEKMALRDSQERLLKTQQHLQAMMQAVPVGISFSDDPSCQRITGNPAVLAQFEVQPEDNLSASAPDCTAPGRQVRFFCDGREIGDAELPLQRAVAENRKIAPMEMEVILPSGRHWFAEASGAPIRNAEGQIIGGVAVTIDISEHKQMEEALRDADRRKDEFLATLAHELRNPLAPLRNALHLLRLTRGDERTAERTYAMMERQVNHLVRLVDDLLEVSRITRGKIELKPESVDLATIIRSAVETSQPLIEAAGHRLAVSLPAEALLLDADSVRLTQVFANLLNNAVKYMEAGGDIRLTAWREDGTALVSIQDRGIGISAEALPHVFDLFTQVDRSAGRAQGGLGIGLALARNLVQLHGGSIAAHSEGLGQGSVFVVRLPLASRPADDAEEIQPAARPSLRRILVVDDNRDAADSLALLLRFLGAEIHVAYDGPAALEALDIFQPAVVLLDIGMPIMDGYEVARQIRQQPRFQNMTLIALTGWGQEADRCRTREAGFDHHLIKPADIDALQTLLASLEDCRQQGSSNLEDNASDGSMA